MGKQYKGEQYGGHKPSIRAYYIIKIKQNYLITKFSHHIAFTFLAFCNAELL